MLVVFPPIFVADTKILYSYNFIVPLMQPQYLPKMVSPNAQAIIKLALERFLYNLGAHFILGSYLLSQ